MSHDIRCACFATFDTLFTPLIHPYAGQELVKAGLALALLGGVTKYAGDKSRLPLRGDIHILIVGDPGLGKSQACRYLAIFLLPTPSIS